MILQETLKANALQFIANNKINVKTANGKTLFKYEQGISPKKEIAVRQCRGTIFSQDFERVLCYPFFRFFNLGEAEADVFDITPNCRFLFKEDGSLMNLYHDDKTWCVSTSGTVEADTPLLLNREVTYRDTFFQILEESGISMDIFKQDHCYMFEILSPNIQSVYQADKDRLVLLGVRNMQTLQEVWYDDIVTEYGGVLDVVKAYALDDATFKAFVENLSPNEEGLVIVSPEIAADGYSFKRVKVKNARWMRLHYLVNSREYDRIAIVLNKEEDELLAYFPNEKPRYDAIRAHLDKMRLTYLGYVVKAKSLIAEGVNKKAYAETFKGIETHCFTPLMTSFADGEFVKNYDDHIKRMHVMGKLKKLIEF